jgi:hypothetical protein
MCDGSGRERFPRARYLTMKRGDVVIATITLARSDAEAAVLERSLTALQQHRLPIVVTDGGSDSRFMQRLASQPDLIVGLSTYGPGLVGQVKSSLAAAMRRGASAILYTEPDKAGFFAHHLLKLIDSAPEPPKTGIVLAARSPQSFATFPPFQRHTEQVINDLCSRVIGRPGDYSYGPFLIDRALATRVLEFPSDLGWGWRPCAFGLAARLGYGLLHAVAELPCPDDQRSEDRHDRAYRLRQLQENSRGLLHSQTLP